MWVDNGDNAEKTCYSSSKDEEFRREEGSGPVDPHPSKEHEEESSRRMPGRRTSSERANKLLMVLRRHRDFSTGQTDPTQPRSAPPMQAADEFRFSIVARASYVRLDDRAGKCPPVVHSTLKPGGADAGTVVASCSSLKGVAGCAPRWRSSASLVRVVDLPFSLSSRFPPYISSSTRQNGSGRC